MTERFWLEDLSALWRSGNLLPTANMPKAAVLNSLTRLLLVSTAVVALLGPARMWLTILLAGLVTILLLYYFNVRGQQGFQVVGRRRLLPPVRVPRTREVSFDFSSSSSEEDDPPPRRPLVQRVKSRPDGLVGEVTTQAPKATISGRITRVTPTTFRKVTRN